LAAQESRENYEKHGRDAENLSNIQKHLGPLAIVESMWKTAIPNRQKPFLQKRTELPATHARQSENPNISNHRRMPLKKTTDI